MIAVALAGVGVVVLRSSPDPETRIRRLVADAVEAFNAEEAGSAIEAFAERWKDETTGIDRQALHRALLFVAMTRRDRYEIRVLEDSLEIELDPDRPDRAQLALEFQLSDQRAKREPWEVRVEAEVARSGGKWRFASSRHETLRGRRPR